MRLPPGPRTPTPIQSLQFFRRPIELFEGCLKRYGPTFTLKLRSRTMVFLTDPAHVQEVFTGNPDVFLSGRANKDFGTFLGRESILAIDGTQHRQIRRLLMPPFRGPRMKAYADKIREVTLAEMATWPVGEPFEMMPAIIRLTQELIFRTIYGVDDPDLIRRFESLFFELVRTRWAGILALFSLARVNLGSWSPWGRHLRKRKALNDLVLEQIDRVRKAGAQGEDVLSLLLREIASKGAELTDQVICDQLISLMGAGHETTACGLTWAFKRLLASPEALERARAEVAQAGALSVEDLGHMPYVDSVVNEVLRLHPPFLFVVRWLNEPTSVAGYDLPRGTRVCPSSYLVHRDSTLYDDPGAFRPERWADKRVNPFQYFPFGGGNRTCIGLPFALYEMKVVVATVLANCRLRLADPARTGYKRHGIVLWPEDGTRVVMEESHVRS